MRRIWQVAFVSIFLVTAGVSKAAVEIVSWTSSAKTLVDITIDDGTAQTTYTAAELIGVDVKDPFSDGAAYEVIAGVGGSNPAAGTRAALIEDLKMDSGFLNLEVWSVNFNAPIFNRPGFDLVLVDWSNSADGDSFNVSLTSGGATVNYNTTTSGKVLSASGSTVTSRFASGTSVANLAAAESVALSANGTTSVSNFVFVGIDLTALGVASGASISDLYFSGGSGIDPVSIFGLPNVPEPASIGLLSAGLLVMLRRRRGDA